MAEGPPPPPVERRRGRFWLNLGEATAVLAVIIAALSFWDSHRQHSEAQRQAAAAARAHAALVLEGTARDDGRRIVLAAVEPGQVIQSQRYIFPTDIAADPREVAAATPAIEIAWLSDGLGRALDKAHAKGAGAGRLPVAIVTTFVEDGETRTDRSLYEVGFAWRSRFLLGRVIRLRGISLGQRAAAGDPLALVNREWAATPAGRAAT